MRRVQEILLDDRRIVQAFQRQHLRGDIAIDELSMGPGIRLQGSIGLVHQSRAGLGIVHDQRDREGKNSHNNQPEKNTERERKRPPARGLWRRQPVACLLLWAIFVCRENRRHSLRHTLTSFSAMNRVNLCSDNRDHPHSVTQKMTDNHFYRKAGDNLSCAARKKSTDGYNWVSIV